MALHGQKKNIKLSAPLMRLSFTRQLFFKDTINSLQWLQKRRIRSARVCQSLLKVNYLHTNRESATSAAAVATPDLPNKKSKKTAVAESSPASTPKSILKKKGAEEKANSSAKATVPETADAPARKIKPRKRASDFLSDDEDDKENEEETKSKKQKESAKKVEKKETKKEAPAKKTKKVEVVEQNESEDEGSEEQESENDEIDDQTAELIKGFESSGDEDASEDEGFEAGKAVPRIPDSKKAKRKIQKKLKENDQPDEPGTVYVG